MFPKQNWKEKYFKRKPSVYGNIDQTSYAVRSHLPVIKPDLWKERNAGKAEIKEPIIGRKDHVYFVINTAVGVGGKGMDRAKIVHVGFHLNPVRIGIRDPEVISIYPHPISEPAGLIRISEETQKELGASGKSQFSMPAWLSLMLRKSIQRKKEYALP